MVDGYFVVKPGAFGVMGLVKEPEAEFDVGKPCRLRLPGPACLLRLIAGEAPPKE